MNSLKDRGGKRNLRRSTCGRFFFGKNGGLSSAEEVLKVQGANEPNFPLIFKDLKSWFTQELNLTLEILTQIFPKSSFIQFH